MKNRSPLVLIEFVIMLLVFAVAAALCLQAFSYSGSIAGSNELRDRATLEAQNVAEIIKHCDGDFHSAAEIYGGTALDYQWIINYDDLGFTLRAVTDETSIPLLGVGTVTVTSDSGEILLELPLSWQKEGVQ